MHVIPVHVACQFCGTEVVDGWVSLCSTVWGNVGDASLVWEPAEVRVTKRPWRDIGRWGLVTLLAGRLLRRSERAATLCPECGVVVIEPFPVADEEHPEASLTSRTVRPRTTPRAARKAGRRRRGTRSRVRDGW
jgi:hypothetical protein